MIMCTSHYIRWVDVLDFYQLTESSSRVKKIDYFELRYREIVSKGTFLNSLMVLIVELIEIKDLLNRAKYIIILLFCF